MVSHKSSINDNDTDDFCPSLRIFFQIEVYVILKVTNTFITNNGRSLGRSIYVLMIRQIERREREMKCAKHSGHVRSGNILLIWTEYQEDWNGYTWIKTQKSLRQLFPDTLLCIYSVLWDKFKRMLQIITFHLRLCIHIFLPS